MTISKLVEWVSIAVYIAWQDADVVIIYLVSIITLVQWLRSYLPSIVQT